MSSKSYIASSPQDKVNSMDRRNAVRVSLAFVALMLVSITSSLVVPQVQITSARLRDYVVGGEVIPTPISAALESVKWILVAGAISAAMALVARKRK